MKYCKIVTLSIALGIFSASNALAIEVPCDAPQQTILPASLSSAGEMTSYEAAVIAYLDDYSAYQTCVYAFVEDNQATLSQADKDDIRSQYDAVTADARSYSEEWNALYSAYAQAQ